MTQAQGSLQQEQVALVAAIRAVVPAEERQLQATLRGLLAQLMESPAEPQLLFAALASLAETRDLHATEQARRLGWQVAWLSRQLGMEESEAQCVGTAAMLHDVGKLALPSGLLFRPSVLNGEERQQVQRHALFGARVLEVPGSPLLQTASRIAASHHERWDGRGYPAGLSGEQIPLEARIVHLFDVYSALVSVRPHRQAWRSEDALDYVRGQAGWKFDPQIVRLFQELQAVQAV